ncbi:MAG: hypothetical protein SPL80_08360 [Bacilli bacterium]|nr:hypothetical protein [Bacilli bacterium]
MSERRLVIPEARLFIDGKAVFVTPDQVKEGVVPRESEFTDPDSEFGVRYVKDCKGHYGPYFKLYLSLEDYKRLSPERKTAWDILSDQRHYANGPWHRKWEAMFSSFCRMETTIKNEKTGILKRADAFFEQGDTIIEFQHSYIGEDFETRGAHYSSLGLNMVWLCDLTKGNVLPQEDGTYLVLEDNARPFFRVAMNPKNLARFPVFIQAKDRLIYLIKEIWRKDTDGEIKATVRVFRPAGIFTEKEFIECIKNKDERFMSESFASKEKFEKKTLFELWEKHFSRMVVLEADQDKILAFYSNGKGGMMRNFETGNVQALYMSKNERTGRYVKNYDKWYDVSSARAKAKNWILLETQLTAGK